MNGCHMNLIKNKASYIALLLLPLLLMAANLAPTTLPKGFLEKLPVLVKLNDEEFNQLLALAQKQSEIENKAVKVSAQQE